MRDIPPISFAAAPFSAWFRLDLRLAAKTEVDRAADMYRGSRAQRWGAAAHRSRARHTALSHRWSSPRLSPCCSSPRWSRWS